MCADGSYSRIEDAVGECPECGGRIDKDNDTVEECCNHAQVIVKNMLTLIL